MIKTRRAIRRARARNLMRLGAALAASLALAGCSCGNKPKPPGWPDDNFGNLMQNGQDMMDMNHPDLAVPVYQDAVRAALLSGDAASIANAYYNLGAAQLSADDASGASATVARATDALKPFGMQDDFRALILRAAVDTRARRYQDSLNATQKLLKADNVPTSFVAQAHYIAGVDAAELGDRAQARSARDKLAGMARTPWQKNNLLELDARLDILDGRNAQAATATRRLAVLRRQEGDFDGMRQALSLEIRALQGHGGGNDADAQIAELRARIAQSRQSETTIRQGS